MKIFFVFIFSSIYLSAPAQQFYNDAQLWLNLYLEKKISKKFALHLNQQDRWTQNVSQFELAYADIGITYKVTKNVKVLGDYVMALKKKDNGIYSKRHQYYVALVVKKDFLKWRFMYRNMLQLQNFDPYTRNDGYIQYIYDRHKVSIKYFATKRFEFYVAEELYLPLNNPQLKTFERSRSFTGMFYNISKYQQLEFYFAFQAELQKGYWYKQDKHYDNSLLKHDFIYGIGYSVYF